MNCPATKRANDPRGFLAKPRWQRLIIVLGGPLMNVVLAVALLTGLYMVKYQKVVDADNGAVIGSVAPNTPAAKAGIQDGDRIVKLGGQRNPTWDDIIMKEIESASRPMQLTIERNGKEFDTTVTPVLDERSGAGTAGWSEKGEVQLGPVTAGMPAQKVGLQQGDLILSAGRPSHPRDRALPRGHPRQRRQARGHRFPAQWQAHAGHRAAGVEHRRWTSPAG